MDWEERQRGRRQGSRREKQPENGQIGVGQISGPAEVKISRSRHRHHRSQWISMTAVLLFLAVESAVVVSCYGFPTFTQARLDVRPEKHAKKGTLASGEPGETKPAEAGSFRVVLSQLPTTKTGSRGCNIEYEDPGESHYSSGIGLYLKEIGRLIGGATRVDPGYYVESIQLKESLSAGGHPVIVRIGLFEEKVPASRMSIDITLRIIEKQEEETG